MDPDVVRDLFAEFGPVEVRRMFSGAGVFVDGVMIALIARDVIHLKADGETIPAFQAEGLTPFTYATKNGEHTLNSYWRMPDRLYDDTEELGRWARAAHAAALRSGRASRRPHPAKARKKKAVTKKTSGKALRRRASRSPPSRPRGRSRK
jgi:DNA transformation protein